MNSEQLCYLLVALEEKIVREQMKDYVNTPFIKNLLDIIEPLNFQIQRTMNEERREAQRMKEKWERPGPFLKTQSKPIDLNHDPYDNRS